MHDPHVPFHPPTEPRAHPLANPSLGTGDGSGLGTGDGSGLGAGVGHGNGARLGDELGAPCTWVATTARTKTTQATTPWPRRIVEARDRSSRVGSVGDEMRDLSVQVLVI